MNISRTHFYEIKELMHIFNATTSTPVEDVGVQIKDWINEEDRGEYLINILEDYDLRRLQEYLAGD